MLWDSERLVAAAGVRQSARRIGAHDSFPHPGGPGLTSALATFRVLAKGDLDADVALPSGVGC